MLLGDGAAAGHADRRAGARALVVGNAGAARLLPLPLRRRAAGAAGPGHRRRRRRWPRIERMALVSDQWALVRADAVARGRLPDLLSAMAARERPVRARRDGGTAGAARAPPRGRRAIARDLPGGRRRAVRARRRRSWAGSPRPARETDDTRLRPGGPAARAGRRGARPRRGRRGRARRLPLAHRGAADQASALDPNLLDIVVTARPRATPTRRFDDFARRAHAPSRIRPRSAASCTRSRASRRRRWWPAPSTLALTDVVPMQDFTSYLSVLLANRATREEAWRSDPRPLGRGARQGRLADAAPPPGRSAGSAARATPSRGGRGVPGRAPDRRRPKQATPQTLERMRMDVALARATLMPADLGVARAQCADGQ